MKPDFRPRRWTACDEHLNVGYPVEVVAASDYDSLAAVTNKHREGREACALRLKDAYTENDRLTLHREVLVARMERLERGLRSIAGHLSSCRDGATASDVSLCIDIANHAFDLHEIMKVDNETGERRANDLAPAPKE